MHELLGILAVFALVAANGFFVAAEFSLVAVRRSRVAELASGGQINAKILLRATGNLDANLAATQFGITISSLGLGWIGEPALVELILPVLNLLPLSLALASAGAHALAITVAFIIITVLHIVLGELAPKTLALQRSERTALAVVRPLGLFLFVFRPVIVTLNGLGGLVVRMFGLRPEPGHETNHSPEELRLIIAASHRAGLLNEAQHQMVERVFSLGDRPIADIITPRLQVDWIDADDSCQQMLNAIQESRHEQLLVGRGNIDEPLGMVLKKDLLDQVLRGQGLDPMAVLKQPLVVHETARIFRVLEQFKKAPVRLAIVVDEYGSLDGIVTQTDLLEAIAGELPDVEGEEPDIVTREDGSLLIDGLTPAHHAFHRLGLRQRPEDGDFHTIAGFALARLARLPKEGDHFEHGGWRFEIVDMDGRRIDKLLVSRKTAGEASN